MSRRFKVYRYLIEVTAIPLALLLGLFIVTGYCLIKSRAVEALTLGLLTYPICIALHTSRVLRILLVVFALLHGVSGFMLMAMRYVDKRFVKYVESLLIVFSIIVLIEIVILELI
ncbi:MAG TPA: hypothetical protein EYH02_01155 [Ignisphaera aggregans]|uniref:Succinate dehydrogenase n=1 Tax=Ignisphaera aggregans TaxID=334771 RepID=A0A832YS24_9CREN|nr:hypothetical protein [Ignisphaera aggregans]